MLFTVGGRSKYRRLVALFLIAGMLIPGGVLLAQDKQISEIKIVGNDHVSSDAILAAIALKPGMPFSEGSVEQAKQAIESMGYFQSGVTVGTESNDAGVKAIFNVVENPVVKEIKVTGNTVVPTEKLLSLMRTSVGSVLNTNTLLKQDIRAVEKYYEDQGYAAYVTEDIGIDPQTGVLNVPVMEVKIESIKLTGNKKTKDYVLLREMKQKPGDVYNMKTLHADLQKIYDLDIFELESALPYKTEAGSDLGKVNIVIPVKEKKTGEVSVGLGYSSKQKLVGQAKLAENNFRGRAQKVNALWEQSGSRGSSYELGFFEPWLDRNNTSLGVNLYNKLIYRFSSNFLNNQNSTGNNYDERRKGGSVTVSRPLSQFNRGFLTLRTESVDSSFAGTDPIFAVINQPATITSGTARMTNDTRDSQLDPFRGGYHSLAIELGGSKFPALVNESSEIHPFTKYSADIRNYFSKGGPRKEVTEKRRRIATRLMVGSLTGTVPFSEQYFVGGAETLRGFKEDRFWGKYMLLASAEYRFPLAPSLTGVGFLDYGDAWGAPPQYRLSNGGPLVTGFDQSEGFKGNLGYGIGIRVQTPIGPLRLDYGFSKEGSRAHFSIGNSF